MKRRQPQFDSDKDSKREISRYMRRDTLIHILIIVTVLCGTGIYFAVEYGARIDFICNKFLK